MLAISLSQLPINLVTFEANSHIDSLNWRVFDGGGSQD
jgi:hypothetical protein